VRFVSDEMKPQLTR